MERSGSEETSGSGAFVCSTSKDTFTERESLAEHYRSDLHRYNLKRKVAGMCRAASREAASAATVNALGEFATTFCPHVACAPSARASRT